LKSKIIGEEIEDLKCDEECQRNKSKIFERYKFNENKPHELLQKEDYFEIENVDKLDLENFGKIFLNLKRNNEFSFRVNHDSLDGNIISLELPGKLTILIRVDRTNKNPKAV
jgi:hypothetical protein